MIKRAVSGPSVEIPTSYNLLCIIILALGEQKLSSVQGFWDGIITWYGIYGRDYPWRRTVNPFHILIAEFLLQQTNVRKVQEVYEIFITKYPIPKQLADADISEVEGIINPIGLNYRAGRLKKSAEIICSDGKGEVPASADELRHLPGVGPYIADAVLCYAFGLKTVPIDTNVIRLFCRYFGLRSDKSRPRTDRQLSEKIRQHYRLFDSTRIPNLAVLDFAGIECTAKRPSCEQCCISAECFFILNSKSY